MIGAGCLHSGELGESNLDQKQQLAEKFGDPSGIGTYSVAGQLEKGIYGGPTWIRTKDQSVMSRPLYR